MSLQPNTPIALAYQVRDRFGYSDFGSSLWLLVIALLLLANSAGCARLQLPAIDPSGNQLFLPGSSTQLLTPRSSGGGCLGLKSLCGGKQPSYGDTFQPAPFSQPAPIAPPQYPVQPAYQHPADPPPCDGKSSCGKTHHLAGHKKQHVIPKIDGHKTPGQNGQIIMTPSRIVAPVGSEVVVLAGICGGDGYFVKNQPLEWMLSNDSVGQIIEVGGQNHPNFNKAVPPTSKKFDGQYAHGRTGLKDILLSRGTPTPVDDIELVQGQTYISVSSESPGTTYVTGVAPKAEGWDKRRASTVIHWVDGLWSIPVPTNATAGTVHPLTTVISSSNGDGGLKDWIVRYAIVGGAPAEFAPAGSQTAEAKSNQEGQATVQIRQPSGQFAPGTTQVRVDVVRPSIFGQPELVVESGITSVTWSAPALTLRAIGPRTAGLDQPFNYRVEVSNPGDQVARDVIVRTKDLDAAVEYISSNPKPTEYGRQYEWKLGDIPPGSAPRTIDVQWKSKKRGSTGICFEVLSESDRLRTEACGETEISVPCLGLDISGPTTARVGESITFNLNVQNQCDEALEGIRLIARHPNGLLRPGKSSPAVYDLDQLQFNETRTLPLTFIAQSPGTQCFDVEITAKNGHTSNAKRCVEVGDLSQQQLESQIGLEISGGRPASIGGETLVSIAVTNRGNTPLSNPVLTNRISSSLEPTFLTDGYNHEFFGDDELAVYLGQINPGETKRLEIKYAGKIVDGDAISEYTVTTPLGAKATEQVKIRVEPAGTQPGGNVPDFENGGGTIGIPKDPNIGAANPAADLEVKVRSVSRNIQMLNSDQNNPAAPKSADFEFVVTNNRRTPMRDVDITLNIPPSLKLTDFNFGSTNLDLVQRSDDFTQFFVRRCLELRPGESLTFLATVTGQQPGQAEFRVTAASTDMTGTAVGSDVVMVAP